MNAAVEVTPRDRFSGLDDAGLLEVENHYACNVCGHKTKLPLFLLGERASRWARSGPEEPELDDEDIPAFARLLDPMLNAGPNRMSVELTCRCDRPVAFVIEVVPGKFVERFRPLLVVERAP